MSERTTPDSKRHHDITDIQNVLIRSGVYDQVFSLRHLLKNIRQNESYSTGSNQNFIPIRDSEHNQPFKTDGEHWPIKGFEHGQSIQAYESQEPMAIELDSHNQLLQQAGNRLVCASGCKQTLFDVKEAAVCSSSFSSLLSQTVIELYASTSTNVLFNFVSPSLMKTIC